jgi:hypothetical protein
MGLLQGLDAKLQQDAGEIEPEGEPFCRKDGHAGQGQQHGGPQPDIAPAGQPMARIILSIVLPSTSGGSDFPAGSGRCAGHGLTGAASW